MVNTPGIGGAINKVAEQAVDKSEKAEPKAADARDQSAFQQAMHPDEGGKAGSPDAVNAAQGGQVQTDGARIKSPGDTVLAGMDKLRADQSTMASDANKLNSVKDMSPQEMLSVKMEVDKVSYEEQMAIKTTTSVENDVKQLLKEQ